MKRTMLFLTLLALVVLGLSAYAEPAEVDLDLSVMPVSIAYAQAVAIQREPESYAGQMLRIEGTFNYSEARQKGLVIVSGKSFCCETSLDFACAEPLCYPEDYPELYSHIIVVGRYDLSEEENGLYFLTDAIIETP